MTTVQEAGQLGGIKTLERKGKAYFKEIQLKSAKKRKENNIAQKQAQTTT